MSVKFSEIIAEKLSSLKLDGQKLSTLTQKGNAGLVEQFFTESVQLNLENHKENLQSQLYIACFWGFNEIVKNLVEKGADVNWQNNNTLWTPLHAATFQEHGMIILFLINCNACTYSKDSEGRTPCDFASASEKVWPLFAACGCNRTSKNELIQKKVLRQTEHGNSGEHGNNEYIAPKYFNHNDGNVLGDDSVPSNKPLNINIWR